MAGGSAEGKRKLISDPQTSGGLLVSCAPAAEKRVIEEFKRQGFSFARRIGSMQAGTPELAVILARRSPSPQTGGPPFSSGPAAARPRGGECSPAKTPPCAGRPPRAKAPIER